MIICKFNPEPLNENLNYNFEFTNFKNNRNRLNFTRFSVPPSLHPNPKYVQFIFDVDENNGKSKMFFHTKFSDWHPQIAFSSSSSDLCNKFLLKITKFLIKFSLEPFYNVINCQIFCLITITVNNWKARSGSSLRIFNQNNSLREYNKSNSLN